MKTKVAIAFFVLTGLIAVNFVQAAEPVPASKTTTNSVKEQIRKNISYPEFAKNEKLEGEVAVEVKILGNGSLKVEESNSFNKELQAYVVEEIEEIQSDEYLEFAGQSVLLKVRFKLL